MQGEEIVEKEGGIGASNWLPNGGGGERLDEIGMEEKGWASTDTTKRESKKENELGRVSFNSTRRISFGWDEIQYNTIRYDTIQYQVFFTYTTQILSRTHGLVWFALLCPLVFTLPFPSFIISPTNGPNVSGPVLSAHISKLTQTITTRVSSPSSFR